MTIDEARPMLAKEFADVVTYLDILSMQVGVDLGQATIDKFNEVSERVGSTVRLAADDWHHVSLDALQGHGPARTVPSLREDDNSPEAA
jgi:hypothetical protein